MAVDERSREWWAWSAVAVAILLGSIRIATTWRVFSHTFDEPIHVAAGFAVLTRGQYDLDFEHPPLARVLFALGPVLSGAKVNTDFDRMDQGRQILTRGGHYRHNLAESRAGNLPFFIVAALVVAAWAKRLGGRAAMVLSALLLASLPPLLGHAGLATTDMSVAAMTSLALFCFWLWLERPTWRNALLLAFAVGAGLLSKFSFPVFFGAGAVVAVIVRLRDGLGSMRRARTAAQLSVALLIALLMVWSAYRFSVATTNQVRASFFAPTDPWNVAARYAAVPGYEWVRPDIVKRYWRYGRDLKARGIHDVDFVDWAKAAGYPSPLAGRSGDTMSGAPAPPPLSRKEKLLEPFRRAGGWFSAHVPIPAPEFVTGIMYVKRHSEIGHSSYFMGDYRDRGWWYYFPLIFLFKTPIAFTLLAIAGVVMLARRGLRQRDGEALLVAVAPLAMFMPAMASGINIGIRHILAVYPLLTVAAACAAVGLWRGRSRDSSPEAGASNRVSQTLKRSTVAVLLLWYFVGTSAAHPDYLAYFNELAGGRPDRIAVDSNLDWGQDMLRLADLAQRRHIEELHIAYFGSVIWRTPILRPLEPGVCTPGWLAISETLIKQGGPDQRGMGYKWLEKWPWEEVGRSIRLYRIPETACKGARE